jgi:plasmid stabilization system protein ParE
MQVFWSDTATETLRDIYVYYKELAGKNTAGKIKRTIFTATKQLVRYPQSGQIEENLKLLGEDHRYLIAGNYKIIYKNVNAGVLVTDVFDTRQDPSKINITRRRKSEKK